MQNYLSSATGKYDVRIEQELNVHGKCPKLSTSEEKLKRNTELIVKRNRYDNIMYIIRRTFTNTRRKWSFESILFEIRLNMHIKFKNRIDSKNHFFWYLHESESQCNFQNMHI